jgi:hypothetical protein
MVSVATNLQLEGRPLAIFPCRNKKPACEHGFKDATSDPTEIAALFRRYPGTREIGVPTGEINAFDVLDIDLAGIKFWEENRHRLPPTRTHETQSGGHHLLFKHAPGLRCSSGRIAPGIDVRADGGFIVWWPAQFYPVLDAPVADWPAWLLEPAREKQHRPTAAFLMPMNNEGSGPLMARPQEVPKVLYFKVCDLMKGASGHNRRRVLGLLRTVTEKRKYRNQALNDMAFNFRELISAGVITRDAVESLLIEAATLNGYVAKDGLADAVKTIRSGLDHQAQEPHPFLSEEERRS